MSFAKHENSDINMELVADLMAKRFSLNIISNTFIKGEYFRCDTIETFLFTEKYIGIKTIYSLKRDMAYKLVLFGINESDNDLYTNKLVEKVQTLSLAYFSNIGLLSTLIN